jgi:hypothetical protein
MAYEHYPMSLARLPLALIQLQACLSCDDSKRTHCNAGVAAFLVPSPPYLCRWYASHIIGRVNTVLYKWSGRQVLYDDDPRGS